ncbi:MAG: hypothetical protein DRR19_32540 [Candidatus Parabeggiatoa sp. nov. 1]|nr:MAG: hypothetical protein DRR19_32540 [Gammaproteobacteria bacterium]
MSNKEVSHPYFDYMRDSGLILLKKKGIVIKNTLLETAEKVFKAELIELPVLMSRNVLDYVNSSYVRESIFCDTKKKKYLLCGDPTDSILFHFLPQMKVNQSFVTCSHVFRNISPIKKEFRLSEFQMFTVVRLIDRRKTTPKEAITQFIDELKRWADQFDCLVHFTKNSTSEKTPVDYNVLLEKDGRRANLGHLTLQNLGYIHDNYRKRQLVAFGLGLEGLLNFLYQK